MSLRKHKVKVGVIRELSKTRSRNLVIMTGTDIVDLPEPLRSEVQYAYAYSTNPAQLEDYAVQVISMGFTKAAFKLRYKAVLLLTQQELVSEVEAPILKQDRRFFP